MLWFYYVASKNLQCFNMFNMFNCDNWVNFITSNNSIKTYDE